MSSSPTTRLNRAEDIGITRLARIPHLRALAWAGDALYASRGYDVLRAKVEDPSRGLNWQQVGSFRPSWNRKLSVSTRLTVRLFRDGFHALAVLPSGNLVGAVPGAIVTLAPNQSEFRSTHKIIRGTRPLHITAVPSGTVFWGEYFDNSARDEVHIYASADSGASWSVAYTFPKGCIRHVHNIVHDPWQNCLWILTGDNAGECRILRASCALSDVEVVLQGNQQARAVAAIATEEGLYFSSDTPLETNFIYHLDRRGTLMQLAAISSSSICGCRVNNKLFFSTMVEPSEVNRDRAVRVYAADFGKAQRWDSILSWKKDSWPLRLFQYGNAFLPGGINRTRFLALSTIAVESDDLVTSIYSL